MDDGTAAIVYIIFPAQEISLHAPSVIIDLIFGAKQRELLLDPAFYHSANLNLKRRQKRQQLLMDYPDFLPVTIVYMKLMSQRQEFRLHKILWIPLLVIHVIGICPRKYSLFDQ